MYFNISLKDVFCTSLLLLLTVLEGNTLRKLQQVNLECFIEIIGLTLEFFIQTRLVASFSFFVPLRFQSMVVMLVSRACLRPTATVLPYDSSVEKFQSPSDFFKEEVSIKS